ncbi:recombination-associated protein RdgC [Enterobacter sp. BRE11]|nr:recombination-associated protein RdgC [Enterobacter sp. BRE11]
MKSPFFKNVMVYSLNRDLPLNAEELEQQLQTMTFTPCAAQDMAKSGWIDVTAEGPLLAENGQYLLCCQTESKIMPAATLNDYVAERVEKMEREQGRKVRRNERVSLKDEALHTLLPRAFTRRSQAYIWIDSVNNRVYVDASSAKAAEDMLAMLRKTIGSLPVVPIMAAEPVELTLTEWLRSGEMPAGFVLGDEAELVAILEDGGKIRCKKQDLITDEMRTHIEAGKVVTQLSLDWQERIFCRVADNLSIKGIKYADMLTQQNDDIDREDHRARMLADFMLFTSEFSGFFSGLMDALGGEAKR